MAKRARKVEQISIFLENRTGVIAEVSNALTEQEINILALTVLDSFDIATMRIVVDNPDHAREALRAAGAAYVSVPVLAIDVPNKPGAIGMVGLRIAEAKVNIEYMYGSTYPGSPCAQMICRIADEDLERVLELDFSMEE